MCHRLCTGLIEALMQSHVGRIAVLAAVVIPAIACGPFHRGGPPDAVVVFKNEATDQADVYALGPGGEPTRIGTVFAGRTDTLRVPTSVRRDQSRQHHRANLP